MRYSLFLLLLLSSCTYNEIIPVCEPNEQEFSDLVQPIIEEKCIGCHDETAGIPPILITYDGVIDAVNNYSLKTRVIDLQMPPYGNSPLSVSEINIITNWIGCE